MSEAYPAIKPWEWLVIPEYWTDKIQMYLQAKAKIQPIVEANHRRQAAAAANAS